MGVRRRASWLLFQALASSERLTNNCEPVYPLGQMSSVKMSVPVTGSGGPPGRDRLRHEAITGLGVAWCEEGLTNMSKALGFRRSIMDTSRVAQTSILRLWKVEAEG